MTHFRVFSDLHLEFADWTPPPAPADAVLLAGDIAVGTHGIEWARRQFPGMPIVYVPGNHEFYGAELPDAVDALRAKAKALDVHFLDGEECVIEGTRFLGTTLWTDYALYGSDEPELDEAMTTAKQEMNDFRMIRWRGGHALTPELIREIHSERVQWLGDRLAESFSGPTVVMTHHLPHRLSIHPKYEGTRLNSSFASDLDRLVRAPVALWIHGHTHESIDYVVNGTRVFCNPRGYLPREPNPSFSPLGVVDLEPT